MKIRIKIYTSKMISLYFFSALVMFLFEYFVLVKLYKRSKSLQAISYFVAPLMIVVALWVTLFIQRKLNITPTRINPLLLFIILILFELPLSLYGYEITPNASILERMVVAGTFGTASVLIASAMVSE
jgi:hypothetical protein